MQEQKKVSDLEISVDDDELLFDDDESTSDSDGPEEFWHVLMVDDDEQVHQSTVLALADELILGKGLRFSHAKSGKEAMDMIVQGAPVPDMAFVDMVMETADAGLLFAQKAKADPSWAQMRILLRSGQPGFSNEMEQAKNIGVEGFAQKANVSRAVLLSALVEILSGREFFMA